MVLHNRLLYRGKHKPDICGIGRLRETVGRRVRFTNRIKRGSRDGERVLWINTEPSSICLHELQQDELGSLVNVRSTNVLGTVTFQWDLVRSRSAYRAVVIMTPPYLWDLAPEYVYLVHEENNRRPQEPSRVHNGLKEHQRLRHPVLN